MNSFLTPLLGALLGLIFGSANHVSPTNPTKEAWTCDAPAWVGNPAVTNNLFVGTVEMKCHVQGLSGKGMTDLQAHMVDYIVANAETVHSGPTAETYQGMASTYTDVTVQLGNETESVLVRADTHSATDGSTKLVYAVLSKEVAGTGQAKALKKVDANYTVVPSSEAGFYEVTLASTAQVQKPKLVPVGVFTSQVKSEMEKELKATASDALVEISSHL